MQGPKPKKVLVIGGAGYVGASLCNTLAVQQIPFAVYDNFSVGSKDRLLEKGWQFFEGDVKDQSTLRKVIADYAPTNIIALAAIHYIPYCVAHPEETEAVNVTGIQNIINAIHDIDSTIELLFSSSAAVYKDSALPLSETNELQPIDNYGESKLEAEQLIKQQLDEYKIVRLFNVYGLSDTNPHVIPKIYKALKDGVPQLQLGNIEPKRDYVHVDDVAAALVAVMESGRNHETYNVGTGNAHSVSDVISLLTEQLHCQPEVITNSPSDMRKSERMVLQSSIQKITDHTGWAPTYDLANGLQTLEA